MEVPSKVVGTESDSETAVMAVMVFESCKISLETVCGSRDSGIVEVMKHMWQGFDQHTASTLEIADYPAAFWKRMACGLPSTVQLMGVRPLAWSGVKKAWSCG